jgi:hypothetical protein
MKTVLKAMACAALAAAAWRVVQCFNARSPLGDGDGAREALDARNRYRRAIQRWENEGGTALNRRRGDNRKRERRAPAGNQPSISPSGGDRIDPSP